MKSAYKIFFDDDLRSRLEAAAKSNGRSLAEEIRARLDETFLPSHGSLRSLGTDLLGVADQVMAGCWWAPFGSWHDDPRVHDALSVAINRWFEITKPPAAPAGAFDDLVDTRTLGMAAATAYLNSGKREQREAGETEKARAGLERSRKSNAHRATKAARKDDE